MTKPMSSVPIGRVEYRSLAYAVGTITSETAAYKVCLQGFLWYDINRPLIMKYM